MSQVNRQTGFQALGLPSGAALRGDCRAAAQLPAGRALAEGARSGQGPGVSGGPRLPSASAPHAAAAV